MNNRLAVIVAALLLLGGVFTAGIVWSSLNHVEQRRAYRSAIDQAARLSADNAALEKENGELKARIAKFERQLQINQIAYDKLTTQLGDSASYINELREDLDFYRSIISPDDNEAGVKIQGWQVRRTENGSDFRYKLTVVQALNHDKSVAGEATVFIDGTRQGMPVRLPMADTGEAPGDLSFRYFQVFEGRFSLPAGFEPSAVVVRIVSAPVGSGRKTEMERRFDWSLDDPGPSA